MILLLAAAAAAFLFLRKDPVTDLEAFVNDVNQGLSKGDFAVALFNSCSRHLNTGAALLATAMGVLESGYGNAAAYKHGYNVFNITDGGYWSARGGKTWLQSNADDEFDAQGNVKRISQKWRVYDSMDQSVDDYIDFLARQNGGRYKKAHAALLANQPAQFVGELYNAGYFTLAPSEYLSRLTGVLKTVSAMTGVS